MNTDGTDLRRLTPKTRYVAFPTWSPDGQHLAALCYHGPTRSYGICIMDINGTTLTFIAENGFEGRIAWKP
jgi:Tol biopolymer transport system component